MESKTYDRSLGHDILILVVKSPPQKHMTLNGPATSEGL